MRIFFVGVIVLALFGCATSSKNISAQYVSPLEYKDYDCDQLATEMRRISRRVNELAGTVDKNAKKDKVKTGVGLVLFWPALFFIKGDSQQASEYGRLKGEYEAVEQASVQKKCATQIN